MERRISVGIFGIFGPKYVDHLQRWSRIFQSEKTEANLPFEFRHYWHNGKHPCGPLSVVMPNIRGIEWSLRAFASMRAVRLFLRARAVINFLMRAASTLEITNGEQRALRKFSDSWNLSLFMKTLFFAKQSGWHLQNRTTLRCKARQHDKALSPFNHSQ